MNNDLKYTLTLQDHFSKTMIGASNQTKILDDKMSSLNGKTKSLKNNISSLGSEFSNIAAAAAGYLAFTSMASFTRDVVTATAEMQAFRNAIIASSRNEDEGIVNLSFLNKEVDRLGLNLIAAQKGYKTFSGSVMGSSIQGAKANKVFTQLAEASTVMGLSADQQEGAFLALGQMISKGTVQAEELRGQLGERIPGAFQIGARAMGMTTQQLGKAMQDGLVKADEFVVKFGDELQKTFGPKLEKATQSLQSNLNRMSNSWERVKVTIGESQSGIIASTIHWAESMLSNFNEVISSLNRMDKAFKESGKDLDYTLMEKFNNFMFGGSTSDLANMFTGGKGKMDMFERSLNTMYVKSSERDLVSALSSKAQLLRLSSSFSKSFARKDISKLEYDRSTALINAALKTVNSSISGFKSLGLDNKVAGDKNPNTAQSKIGSATEWNIPRQNVYINVDKFGVVEQLNVETMKDAAKEVKEDWSKALLEVLNDANLIARR